MAALQTLRCVLCTHVSSHVRSASLKMRPPLQQFQLVNAFRFTDDANKSAQELPDPHVLVQDPSDPEKVRYNTDNKDHEELDLALDEIEISDEQFVEGTIIALEDYMPGIKDMTEEEKQSMIDMVKRNKNQRIWGRKAK